MKNLRDYICVFALLFSCYNAKSQNAINHESQNHGFQCIVVEIEAAFMNGNESDFRKYVMSNISYPDSLVVFKKKAPKHKEQKGFESNIDTVKLTTRIQFTVDKNGIVTNANISESSGVYALDKKALEAVQNSPVWTPASCYGKFVAQHFDIPIYFYKKH